MKTLRPGMLAALAAVLTLALAATVWLLLGWDCPFRRWTGWDCPGCGATRGAALLWRGDWRGALAANPGLPVLLVLLALWQGQARWRHRSEPGWGLLGLTLCYWAARNIPL